MAADTFPRQYARTRRLSLGEPRSVTVLAGGATVLFLRSRGGSDPVNCLWAVDLDVTTNAERPVADPLALLAEGDTELPLAERARRERMREQADGITSYATSADGGRVVFALGGRLYTAGTRKGEESPPVALASAEGAFDPRLSPNGTTVAYVADGAVRVVPADGTPGDRLLVGEHQQNDSQGDSHDDDVTWGMPDFIAAEELNRFRGYWWSPDGSSLAVARVDNSAVQRWWIADPANPDRPPVAHRYPAAGTANADVSLWLVDAGHGTRTEVLWDRDMLPYLVDVTWTLPGLVLVVMDRRQGRQQTLVVEHTGPSAGHVSTVADHFDDAWVERSPGTPVLLADGRLLSAIDTYVGTVDLADEPEGTRALVIDVPAGEFQPVTPSNLQVRRVVHADSSRVILVAGAARAVAGVDIPADPACTSVMWWPLASEGGDGGSPVIVAGSSSDPGVHDATAEGDVVVVRSASVDRLRADHRIMRVVDGKAHEIATIANHAEVALVSPQPVFLRAGARGLPVAVLLPRTAVADDLLLLPVLMDPYGGPHAQRVVAGRNAFATSQWLADQGFVVVVVDGRGTPGLGPVFEREVHGDLARPVLDDQITGLLRAAEEFPQMDLSRVAIRGWSFGGYLAALAVLRRPDVFHAAVVGAPVTDWRLYDTAYTERYLGDPNVQPDVYDRSSLLADAAGLVRPMMLIHGLADDNVVSAHTFRLSSALLAAGRPHEVLPLTGVTHMTPQEAVAENLLLLQVEFLRRALNLNQNQNQK